LPGISLPPLSAAFGLALAAFSIAVVGLIQGTGVSKTVPNRDGTYPDVNRDFLGQGIGNLAAGLVGGMPVGGSVSSTALIVQMGATRRLANFIVGPVIALVLLFLSGAVEMIPRAALGAVLIVVGARSVDVDAVRTVWHTSLPARAIMTATFVAMLLVPVQYAVFLGIALSVVQYVYSASLDVRVVRLRPLPGGSYAEEPPPAVLPSREVTALDIYGSVFYAGADVIEKLLPSPLGSMRAAVILRMRGRTDVGSTFITMLSRYHADVERAGGRLMLAGVGPELADQLDRTGLTALLGPENIVTAQPILTASMEAAIRDAEAWLAWSD
ncbi:MAG: SulP family inorganic anion transporter, partial [Actinobacteria bacterium]